MWDTTQVLVQKGQHIRAAVDGTSGGGDTEIWVGVGGEVPPPRRGSEERNKWVEAGSFCIDVSRSLFLWVTEKVFYRSP